MIPRTDAERKKKSDDAAHVPVGSAVVLGIMSGEKSVTVITPAPATHLMTSAYTPVKGCLV
jgi:hypothetical protein